MWVKVTEVVSHFGVSNKINDLRWSKLTFSILDLTLTFWPILDHPKPAPPQTLKSSSAINPKNTTQNRQNVGFGAVSTV